MTDRSMPSSFDEDKEYNETGAQKIGRKLREEPLIPLGCILTTLALYNAWRATRRGDHAQVQRMFRARIGAQAFTVMAMVAGGAYYGADREKRKELIKLEGQQRAEERHQKWLKELEVRDEEEKQLKAAIKRRQDRVQQRRADEKERATGEAKDDGLTAETSSDADGQVPAVEKKEASSVLSALSNAGGWFGTKKSESPKPAEEKKSEAEPPKK
ncbi:hypoxia induced protein conserved region-domain-containing protein [Hypoxylon rubiginosum]|uniref:Hypoxia induced protein conserved region-domain-containing protein n=1 Tax=Hypoxylon rubiginosum TaxID=110542 RepID=A0ACB9ZEJ9_9PEZI|nr:hypoxia induced protein conserved region-domain-containing protein [Hypoxylon rubiginosum]